MGILIVLGHVLPEPHEEHEEDNDDEHDECLATKPGARKCSSPIRSERLNTRPLRSSSISLREAARVIQCTTTTTMVVETTTIDEGANELDRSHEGQSLLAGSSSSRTSVRGLPLSFLAAILVDSFLDGVLLGIAGVAGPGAAFVMAGSLSVEMSFVGLTLATACRGLPWRQTVPAALAGPLTLVGGALAGGLVTGIVEGDPALMAGILGFGTSTVLFMVAEELLLEAHEKSGGEHVWWVDLQLYTGFYWGFLSTKFLPGE